MQKTREFVPCPVCSSHRFEVVHEPWVDVADPIALYGATSGIQGTQRLVACLDCRTIYENPRFPDEVILRGYVSYDEPSHDSQQQMRVKSFHRALRSLQPHLPAKGAKVLDVGTASGGFLEAAKIFGYEAIGLEPSHFMVQRGRQRGLEIVQGTLEQADYPEASFDMVCLWDVLEHLPDPRRALVRARKIIRPNGVLLVNYPDIGTWMAKLAGRRFWWLLSVHLVYFTRDSMRRICQEGGFEVYHFQRHWQSLELGYLEDMAIHLGIPLSRCLRGITPEVIRRIPVPYYASQTTALARVIP